ncbi:MAG: hypothetical protein KBD25_02345 [Rickettsiaceae bacterium]|nr:hypothetical protein [Rickettsiaceae bacterium]
MVAEPDIVRIAAKNEAGRLIGHLVMATEPAETPGKVKAKIQYTPTAGVNPTKITFACMAIGADREKRFDGYTPERKPDGSYEFEREFYADETSLIQVFQDIAPAAGKPILDTRLALARGRLATECYHDPDLTDEQRGRVERRVLDSKTGTLGKPLTGEPSSLPAHQKVVDVYYPAGYDSSKKYPLQVMLDGGLHLRADPYGQSMHTKDILDNLVAKGKMEPTITVFTEPTFPTASPGQDHLPPHLKKWDDTPRLREYACDSDTDRMLACIPRALDGAGILVSPDPKDRCIGGQSMGGLQALYTATRHPDVYGAALPQSPSVWWGPEYGRLPHDAPTSVRPDARVILDQDETWRAPLADVDRQRYLHRMLSTGHDDLSNTDLPPGHDRVRVFMQSGTRETGFNRPKVRGEPPGEPLTQAARALAEQQRFSLYEHNGGHDPGAWATGMTKLLPIMHPPRPQPPRHATPHYAESTESSRAKQREKFESDSPKPRWKS